jgi:hypothetical protein
MIYIHVVENGHSVGLLRQQFVKIFAGGFIHDDLVKALQRCEKMLIVFPLTSFQFHKLLLELVERSRDVVFEMLQLLTIDRCPRYYLFL